MHVRYPMPAFTSSSSHMLCSNTALSPGETAAEIEIRELCQWTTRRSRLTGHAAPVMTPGLGAIKQRWCIVVLSNTTHEPCDCQRLIPS